MVADCSHTINVVKGVRNLNKDSWRESILLMLTLWVDCACVGCVLFASPASYGCTVACCSPVMKQCIGCGKVGVILSPFFAWVTFDIFVFLIWVNWNFVDP
jgi:hypothetical protein